MAKVCKCMNRDAVPKSSKKQNDGGLECSSPRVLDELGGNADGPNAGDEYNRT